MPTYLQQKVAERHTLETLGVVVPTSAIETFTLAISNRVWSAYLTSFNSSGQITASFPVAIGSMFTSTRPRASGQPTLPPTVSTFGAPFASTVAPTVFNFGSQRSSAPTFGSQRSSVPLATPAFNFGSPSVFNFAQPSYSGPPFGASTNMFRPPIGAHGGKKRRSSKNKKKHKTRNKSKNKSKKNKTRKNKK